LKSHWGAIALFDRTTVDTEDCIGYLNHLAIKRNISIVEMVLRPRDRAQIMEDSQYYKLRNYALEFLYR